jgi:hypothetical protein
MPLFFHARDPCRLDKEMQPPLYVDYIKSTYNIHSIQMSLIDNVDPSGNVSDFTLTGSAVSYNHISRNWNNLLSTVQLLVTRYVDLNEVLTLSTSGTNSSGTNASDTTKELLVNKSINVSNDATSDTKYPSVKAIKTYVDTIVSGYTTITSLASEITRATTAEGKLNTSLLNEITRATTAEGVLTTNVSNAVTQLNTSLLNEITRATTAEGVLTTNVSIATSKITALIVPGSSSILSVNKTILVKDPNASSQSTLNDLGLTIIDTPGTVTTINKSLISFLNSGTTLTVNASGITTTGGLNISCGNISVGSSMTTGSIAIGNKSNIYSNNSQFLNGTFRSHITSFNTLSGKIMNVAIGEIPLTPSLTEQTVYNYKTAFNTSSAIFKVNKTPTDNAGYGTTTFELNINGSTTGTAALSGRLSFYIGQGDPNTGVNFVSSVVALGNIVGMTTASITFTNTVGQTIINFVPSSSTFFSASLKSFGCRELGQMVITPM